MVVRLVTEKVSAVPVDDDIRIHDFRTRMAFWKYQSGYKQFYVSVGVSLLFQHAVGMVPPVGTV